MDLSELLSGSVSVQSMLAILATAAAGWFALKKAFSYAKSLTLGGIMAGLLFVAGVTGFGYGVGDICSRPDAEIDTSSLTSADRVKLIETALARGVSAEDLSAIDKIINRSETPKAEEETFNKEAKAEVVIDGNVYRQVSTRKEVPYYETAKDMEVGKITNLSEEKNNLPLGTSVGLLCLGVAVAICGMVKFASIPDAPKK